MIYLQFARFLLPLVLTMVVYGLSGQFLNGGMARMPRATETLAAYGLAWGLTDFLTAPVSQIRQLGLVLATGNASLRRVQGFLLGAGGGLMGLVGLLAVSDLGRWVIVDLHGVDEGLAVVVRQALLLFVPIPLLEGWNRLYSGLLMQVRRTEVVSYATLASIGASILAVFLLLEASFTRHRPILLPIAVVYVGYAVNLAILFWGYRRYVRARLVATEGEELSYRYILGFFWPLALVMAVQGLSRPLINLFVSRGEGGKVALATLAVVYPLAHMPYGWLNEIRSLPAAFRQVENSLERIRHFAIGCGLFSFGLMVIFFWTPVRGFILEELIAVEAELADRCATPLFLFSFFPLTVMVRAYFNGVALVEHRTRALAPSGPSRIGIIWLSLTLLPGLGVHGATLGVAALLSGFLLEAFVVWLGVRGWSKISRIIGNM